MRWRTREFHERKLLDICVLSILFMILVSPTPSIAQVELEDLTGVNVAIYNGAGVMSSSHTALTKMFEWMNASVVSVNATHILDGCLDDYDMLVIPGGSESTCLSELQLNTGVEIIQEFVENGGSFFGICGGATFGANLAGFFDGSMNPVGEPGDIIHMTTMNINQSSSGPDLADCPASLSTMYYGSQCFLPNEGSEVHVIATYDYNDQAGMVAFEYEDGTVFLCSPHPEYEEDNDRDDTTEFDYLYDSDSEWDLLFRVSKWLIEASYVEPTSSTTTTTTPTEATTADILDLPLIAVASTGGVVIVLVAAILYRRMH